jgi:gluconate 2-dehydrogenase gamma chain
MNHRGRKLTRRSFLQGVVATVAVGTAGAAAGCAPSAEEELPAVLRDATPPELKYPAVPPRPAEPPDPGVLRVFTMHEARTVEALTARILPGTPEDPGAREAGVVVYIDHLLATRDGFAEPTYRQPPYAQVASGPTLPEATPGAVWVAADEIERYGFQAILTPREVYRVGLEAVDRYAQARFERDFVDLSEADQDTLVGDLAEGRATGFRQVGAEQFFQVLRRHTAEGMFSDPGYGGNRGLVGWSLIGFPGAQLGRRVGPLRAEGVSRTPQPQADLHPFNPGQDARDGAVLPLSGSDPATWHDAHQDMPPTPAVTPRPTAER